jgi:predicted nucleic acid-binding protein
VGLILIDSTVIVGFLDADDALHQASVTRLKEVVSAHPVAASAISYAELMTGVARGHHPRDRAETFFDVVVRSLLPVDRRVAARAASLRGENRKLRMPDALIIATAETQPEIDRVLCADAAWGKVRGLTRQVDVLVP